jgi:hypothetical protein
MNGIAAHSLLIPDGLLGAHWDVTQDNAAPAQSKRGRIVLGDVFPGVQL